MWPFKKRKPESPEEIAAEKRLDEVTREVAWDEFDKEERRETLTLGFGPLTGELMPEERAGGPDRDPGYERPMRDVLREADEKS
jgi:hypothetical protein